jgi:carboxylesterase type B
MARSLALLSIVLSSLFTFTFAQQLIASLDYGTFQGTYSSEYNISYWKKIPFAAPPLGENRFRAPQPPIKIMNGTYDSDQSFDYCPQRTVREQILTSHLRFC